MECNKPKKAVCGACGYKGILPNGSFAAEIGPNRRKDTHLELLLSPQDESTFINVGIEFGDGGTRYCEIGIACPRCGTLRLNILMPIDKEN